MLTVLVNGAAVGGTEPGGGIRELLPRNHGEHTRQNNHRPFTRPRHLIVGCLREPRPNRNVGVFQTSQDSANTLRVMLAVRIHLNGAVIIHAARILIPGAQRPANAHIVGQVNDERPGSAGNL